MNVRQNSLEAARMSSNRLLEKTYDNLVLCENDFVLEKKQENNHFHVMITN